MTGVAETPALSQASLGQVAPGTDVPPYDRTRLRAGIVHIGVGGFHRSHQALAIDRLLRAGLARDWAICGVGLLEGDRRLISTLRAQDGLYTLVHKRPDGSRERQVIGSIVDLLLAPDDPEAVLERLADPATRVVSLTITEGGYNIDRTTGRFLHENPAVAADVADGGAPTTVFGYVTEGLRRRRDRGLEPLTVMSCDNLPSNGHVARASFLAFAERRDPALAAWIGEHVRFPNSMVDRITPVTSPDDVAEVEQTTGVHDGAPVVCEPFFQWVLEDHFVSGRPPLEKAGVQLVDDVLPYELMKLRLLNVGHQGLCYFGYLMGHRYAHEAAAEPALAQVLLAYMAREGIPTLPPVPGVDLGAYCHELVERFANPEVRDTLARLCAESSDRIPTWLLPVARERLAAGEPVDLCAAIVASWARYAEGVDETGAPITVVDRLRDELAPLAQQQRQDPLAFLRHPDVFGDLVDRPAFTEPYLATLASLHHKGARATVERLAATVSGTSPGATAGALTPEG